MTASLTESVVEEAALAWLETLGYSVKHGPEIAPGELWAERQDFGQVAVKARLRQALVRLNPTLPSEAIEDAFRKLTRPDGPTLIERNRAVHRMLVDGVTVEYRRPEAPSPAHRRALLDFDDPTTTTGWPSTSSPSSRTSTTAGPISCSSSTACRSPSSS